ncbi:MAG: hypothetical protein KME21_31100 [Desmonostoc vinosum HA7617-LM4]|jgi:hypothetical protein|nr:hypothetical protein [Desmonostoc vinosum HA7617-LM4]
MASQKVQVNNRFCYRLTNAFLGEGRSLCARSDGNNNLLMEETGNYSGQLWKLTPHDGSYYRFTNVLLGEDKSLDTAAIRQTGNYSRQVWKLTPLSDSYYRLTNSFQGEGQSLDVYNDGNNAPCMASTGNYSGQWWKLTPIMFPQQSVSSLQKMEQFANQFKSHLVPAFQEIQRLESVKDQLTPQQEAEFAQLYQQTEKLHSIWRQDVLPKSIQEAGVIQKLAVRSQRVLDSKEQKTKNLWNAAKDQKTILLSELKTEFQDLNSYVQQGKALQSTTFNSFQQFDRAVLSVRDATYRVKTHMYTLINQKQALEQQKNISEQQKNEFQSQKKQIEDLGIALMIFSLGIGAIALTTVNSKLAEIEAHLNQKQRQIEATQKLLSFAEANVGQVDALSTHLSGMSKIAELQMGTWQGIGGDLKGLIDLLELSTFDDWLESPIWAVWQQMQWESVEKEVTQYLETVHPLNLR